MNSSDMAMFSSLEKSISDLNKIVVEQSKQIRFLTDRVSTIIPNSSISTTTEYPSKLNSPLNKNYDELTLIHVGALKNIMSLLRDYKRDSYFEIFINVIPKYEEIMNFENDLRPSTYKIIESMWVRVKSDIELLKREVKNDHSIINTYDLTNFIIAQLDNIRHILKLSIKK